MTHKIIVLNGPKLSGKDTLADQIVSRHGGYAHMRFKTRLYTIGATLAGMPVGGYQSLCEGRLTKELRNTSLGGKTPREHLIWASEEVIKPLFGKRYFGGYLASEIFHGFVTNQFQSVVISDSGFIEELSSITFLEDDFTDAEIEDKLEIHVIRLYKEGCNFEGDSRDYIYSEQLAEYLGEDHDAKFHEVLVKDGDIEGTLALIETTVGGC